MTDSKPLAERLEAADEGSREMSDEVLLTLGWTREPLNWPMEDIWFAPSPTPTVQWQGCRCE